MEYRKSNLTTDCNFRNNLFHNRIYVLSSKIGFPQTQRFQSSRSII